MYDQEQLIYIEYLRKICYVNPELAKQFYVYMCHINSILRLPRKWATIPFHLDTSELAVSQ